MGRKRGSSEISSSGVGKGDASVGDGAKASVKKDTSKVTAAPVAPKSKAKSKVHVSAAKTFRDSKGGRSVVKEHEEEVKASDEVEPTLTTVSYRNKKRTLVFGSRGIAARYRHLMDDMRSLMPHHKKDAKLDSKDRLAVINEIAEIKSCGSTVFFEVRKKRDLYLWMSKTPHGPSVKFHVCNVHTMDELRLTGNCLKGSRPLLHFDAGFESAPHLRLLRELFTVIFGTPRGHPKSQPFHDHIMGFYLADGKIWFRHYQIVDTAVEKKDRRKELHKGRSPTNLVEIGPRFVLDIVRIFEGSFGGPTLYLNPHFVSPNMARHGVRLAQADAWSGRIQAASDRKERMERLALPEDPLSTVFK